MDNILYNLTAAYVWDNKETLNTIKCEDALYLYICCYSDSIYQNCDFECNCAEDTFKQREDWMNEYENDMFREVA